MAEREPIRPPSPALLALEGRAWLEFAALLPALPLLARAPRGDGHPVLVLTASNLLVIARHVSPP